MQLVEPMGVNAGDFWPNPFFQREFADATEVNNLKQDAEGNLATRGAVTTDEGSFRDDFTGSGLTTSISGNITTTNGSPLVTGTNFLTNAAIKFGHYLKVDSHAETALARVARIISETQLELETNYSGASTTAAGSFQNYGQATGTGGSFSVGSSALTIASGTTTSSTSYIFRAADYPPIIGTWALSLSQRIANQTAYVGFQNTNTSPSQYARFAFDGTTNTTVKCQTAFSTAAADIEETTVTLPGAGTTATTHRFKIEARQDFCLFWIDDVLVATHRTHLPDPYTTLNVWAGWVNGGSAPATSTNLVIDLISAINFDVLHHSVITPTPVYGDVPHDGVDSGSPVKVGSRAIAHSTNPTAVSAGDRTDLLANRHGILFQIGGHPNTQTVSARITGSTTDGAIIAGTISAGTKVVVTRLSVTISNATTVNVGIKIGFGASTLPADSATGATGILIDSDGFPPGGGINIGDGSGIIGIGADGEEIRITNDAPTSGAIHVTCSYYTIES